MNKNIIQSLFLLLAVNSFSQNNSDTKKWFVENLKHKLKTAIIFKIKIENHSLNSLNLSEYDVRHIYENIDFNFDNKPDVALIIEQKYEKWEIIKVKFRDKAKYRILVLFSQISENEYSLSIVSSNCLNQFTEGIDRKSVV